MLKVEFTTQEDEAIMRMIALFRSALDKTKGIDPNVIMSISEKMDSADRQERENTSP